jgi:hypothetical protein
VPGSLGPLLNLAFGEGGTRMQVELLDVIHYPPPGWAWHTIETLNPEWPAIETVNGVGLRGVP